MNASSNPLNRPAQDPPPPDFEGAESLKLRVHGPDDAKALVYLPGLHGDWTLVGSFRQALGDRVRWIEITYPRTLSWSLDDYAQAVEAALAERQITRGWLLGESFGSQVVWSLIRRKKFTCDGVILAGGFVRHPSRWRVWLADWSLQRVSASMVRRVLVAYGKVAHLRFRRAPEVVEGFSEFLNRRTLLDLRAAHHRVELIRGSDFTSEARSLAVPLYALTGAIDIIVPWIWTRAWLRQHCPALREFKILWHADHTVLASSPIQSARQIQGWLQQETVAAP
jgi:pimeloyl-ACP methyl ester carboxylesterase